MTLTLPTLFQFNPTSFSTQHFGANLTFPLAGEDNIWSYDDLLSDLKTGPLRYPGGDLSEEWFDITNPDSSRVIHNETLNIDERFIPISEFFDYARTTARPVSVIVPTKIFLSEAEDGNGNRTPDIDETALRSFIQDVLTGVYGDVDLHSFQLGADYFGAGNMNSYEYGRLAGEMAAIILDEMTDLNVFVDIWAQSGAEQGASSLAPRYAAFTPEQAVNDIENMYGLSFPPEEAYLENGNVDWLFINNALLITGFEDTSGILIDDIQGVVAQIFSDPDMPDSRHVIFEQIQDTWTYFVPDMNVVVSAWNTRSDLNPSTELGLFQAQEFLNLLEEFSISDTQNAFAFPLHDSDNALTLPDGSLTPAGVMAAWLAFHLPGKFAIDMDLPSARDTEISDDGLDVHAFANGQTYMPNFVFYVTPTDGEASTTLDLSTWLDVNGWAQNPGWIQIEVLGVQDPSAPGYNANSAVIRDVTTAFNPETLMVDVDLNEGEIMQISVQGAPLTAEMYAAFDALTPQQMGQADVRIIGNEDNNVLLGRAEAQGIYGGDGMDEIFTNSFGDQERFFSFGGKGLDQLIGGSGRDWMYGGEDGDLLFGGVGNDRLHTNNGDGDRASGGAGDDALFGGYGANRLEGDEGNDFIRAHGGDDIVMGGAGQDTLEGNRGDDLLDGGDEFDFIYGHVGQDTLYGAEGGDFMYGGLWKDKLYGGDGQDMMYGGQSNDILYAGDGSDALYGGTGNDALYGEKGNNILTGGSDDDKIFGGNGDDLLAGNTGDDVLRGHSGNDEFLFGNLGNVFGGGHDIARGDKGQDRFVFGNSFDTVEILDFQDDILDLSYLNVTHWDDLTVQIGQDNLTITHQEGTIILHGVDSVDDIDALWTTT